MVAEGESDVSGKRTGTEYYVENKEFGVEGGREKRRAWLAAEGIRNRKSR